MSCICCNSVVKIWHFAPVKRIPNGAHTSAMWNDMCMISLHLRQRPEFTASQKCYSSFPLSRHVPELSVQECQEFVHQFVPLIWQGQVSCMWSIGQWSNLAVRELTQHFGNQFSGIVLGSVHNQSRNLKGRC